MLSLGQWRGREGCYSEFNPISNLLLCRFACLLPCLLGTHPWLTFRSAPRVTTRAPQKNGVFSATDGGGLGCPQAIRTGKQTHRPAFFVKNNWLLLCRSVSESPLYLTGTSHEIENSLCRQGQASFQDSRFNTSASLLKIGVA
jgi:hypothetical protein